LKKKKGREMATLAQPQAVQNQGGPTANSFDTASSKMLAFLFQILN